MKISKTANDANTIDWFDVKMPKKPSQDKHVFSSVNKTIKENVDDVVLADECSRIEKCAQNGTQYFYNKSWNEEHINHLIEYAMACSISKDKIVGVEIANLETPKETKTASANSIHVTASTKTENEQKLKLPDAFGIDRRISAISNEKADWQENRPESKLGQAPSMQGIIPIRGGENIFINNNPKLAINQNSIGDANAIDRLAKSEQMDNGARLAKEREERNAKKLENKKQWEQSKIDEMPMRHIVAKGNVFPTESLNAQPGLGHQSRPGIYSSYSPNDLPEKTEGEMIKAANDSRRNSIKHTRTEDKWEEVKESPKMREISSDFTESLKKALRK